MDLSVVPQVARKVIKTKYCGAVIVAAGNASRMGGIDKVMAPLQGEPMIVRTVRAFENCDVIREIVVVTREDLIAPMMALLHPFAKVRQIVVGGADRPESVMRGLQALSGKVKLAAIQDGARPLVSEEVIDRTVRAAHSYGAAAPAVPVKDTVKVVKGAVVQATPDRNSLRAIQTPQVFDLDLLCAALEKARKDGAEITDDCSAVERLDFTVKIVEGDERNIKVTTALDLKIAEVLLEEKQ